MSNFNVRVLLHNAAPSDYFDKLYPEMASRGFTDVVLGKSGLRYKMPPGEYSYVGAASCQQVLAAARDAAAATGHGNAVMVTQVADCWWTGLNIVA